MDIDPDTREYIFKSLMSWDVWDAKGVSKFAMLLPVILGAAGLYWRQPVVNFFQRLTGQDLWDPTVRFLTELPARTDPAEVAAIVILALVLSFLATLYPAWKAARTDPVQVLRYE